MIFTDNLEKPVLGILMKILRRLIIDDIIPTKITASDHRTDDESKVICIRDDAMNQIIKTYDYTYESVCELGSCAGYSYQSP